MTANQRGTLAKLVTGLVHSVTKQESDLEKAQVACSFTFLIPHEIARCLIAACRLVYGIFSARRVSTCETAVISSSLHVLT
jgi:hypothetical protein